MGDLKMYCSFAAGPVESKRVVRAREGQARRLGARAENLYARFILAADLMQASGLSEGLF